MSPQNPTRIQYHRYGGPEQMKLEPFSAPTPGEGEVRVQVRAAAVNALDWKIRNGDMKIMTGRRFPRGLGHDFAGIVDALGDGVSDYHIGDAVFGTASIKTAGAFADLVLVPTKLIAKKPAGVSFEQAAAIGIIGMTASQALITNGKLTAGQSVFINGCLGGVGRIATQIAINLHITVAGSCRPSHREEAERLGVSPIVDFDFDPEGYRGQFDLVFDTAGALSYTAARTLLKPGGQIIDINPTPAKMLRSALPGPFQMQFTKTNPDDLTAIANAVQAGKLDLQIAHTVPLNAAIRALTELETHNTPKGGKLIISPVTDTP
jgi:NADPH:quinone reductase-like Zn-dependent oxidoreductase